MRTMSGSISRTRVKYVLMIDIFISFLIGTDLLRSIHRMENIVLRLWCVSVGICHGGVVLVSVLVLVL